MMLTLLRDAIFLDYPVTFIPDTSEYASYHRLLLKYKAEEFHLS